MQLRYLGIKLKKQERGYWFETACTSTVTITTGHLDTGLALVMGITVVYQYSRHG
jgi:hypothetical protein